MASPEMLKKSVEKSFNAVDLITVTVFAVMFRVMYYIFKMLGVVYPFNHTFMYLVGAFTFAACLALVNKKGAIFLYTIAWCSINFFIQGEIPLYFVLIILLPLIPELYFMSRTSKFAKSGDAYLDTTNMMVTSYIYNIIYFIFNFVMIIQVFMIPTPMNLILIVFGISLVCIGFGTWLGRKTGLRLKALLG